jgi:probable HAF family extracellular repeat protein
LSPFLISLITPPAISDPAYTAIDLGTLQGGENSSWGWDINDLGQAVGHSDAPNGMSIHAFLWENGEMTDLGTLGGTYSWAYGINNSSQITGYSAVNGLIIHGYFWEDGEMNDIGQLPEGRGPFSRSNAINEKGVIAGVCHSSRPGMVVPYSGFIYDFGDWTELPTFGGDESRAYGINDVGDVVGWARFAPPDPTAPRAFLYRNDQMYDLGTFGGNLSWAEGINNDGQIVGWSTDIDGFNRAFIWQDSVMTDLGDFGGDESWAYAINNRGQVVGSATLPDSTRHGFLLDQGVLWDLNDIVQPGLDVVFHGARGINELGQIVTSAELPDETRHAYLLTPDLLELGDPEPGNAGEVNSVTVQNATPGETVYFVWGLKSGITSLGGCSLNLSIKNPRLFGSAVADTYGNVTVSGPVPEIMSGRIIYLQAIEWSSCTLSNLVRFTFR